MSVDLGHAIEVAKRQAFGVGFEHRPDDRTTAAELASGILRLPPHPQFEVETPIDWEQDPFGQRNWRAQLHMLRWLDPIRRLACAGDASLMPFWIEVAQDWIAKNPPVSSHSTYAWADMVDAMRAHTLLLGLPYVDDPEWLLDALEKHGAWLTEPSNLGHSNHALHQHAALLMIGSALGHTEWLELAMDRMVMHASIEFDDEGVNKEAAPGYWLLNYRWIRDLARRAEVEGLDSSPIEAAIAKVPLTLAHATRPDGALEIIGDTAPMTKVNGDFGSPELTYITTDGADGTPPFSTCAIFGAGYAFGRSGWGETERRLVEESFYSLRFGPANAVHGHMDGGSVTYFAGGDPVLTEAGKYAYVNDDMRRYAVGRLGHNVVHIRGMRYDKTAVVELVHHDCNERFDYFLLRDKGYKGVTIEREVIYARGSEALLVVDTVRAKKSVVAESRFHLPHTAEAELQGARVAVRNRSGTATLLWGGKAPKVELVRGRRDPLDGWISPGWGRALETTLVKAVQSGTRFRITTAICPGTVSENRLTAVHGEDGATYCTIEGNHVRERVRLLRGRVAVIPEQGATEITEVTRPRPATGVDRATIDRLEAEGEAARQLMVGNASATEVQAVASALVARLRAGHDYGAGALLRDVPVETMTIPEGLVDSRTRTALNVARRTWDQTPRPIRGALLHVYPDVPKEFNLGALRTVHAVRAGGLLIPARVHLAESRDLVVVFHGALNRAKTELPRFERMRSLGELNVNVMSFADPTLDLDPSLSLGWYLGTRNYDLAPVLGEMIETVAGQRDASRVIILGTSGGGFATLAVGLYVPGSVAIPFSPQTDIRRYHTSYSTRALARIFGDGPLREEDVVRVSLAERYLRVMGSPKIKYFINSGDVHHQREHAEPFCEFIRASRPDLCLSTTTLDLGPGHISPDVDTVNRIVQNVLTDPTTTR